MGLLDDVTQTVKGKAEQVKGDLQTQNGNGVKGGISKIQGKANEELGKLKLKTKQKKAERQGNNR